jgi:DNA-binding response OmpR family regulator
MARILVVDDEEHIRRFYSEELADEGHKVWTTATGHELLKTIDGLQPEVVVLDIRLGGYDGLDLLQEIRNKHHDLPVILCTAYDTYKDDRKSIAADYYVVKSFDLSELKMAIKRAVEASGSGQPTSLGSPLQAGPP